MSVKPIPDGYHSVTPYLTIDGAAEAIEFYKKAFGAVELFRMAMPDGKVGHAEIRIGNSPVMIGEVCPQTGTRAPEGPTPVGMLIYVEDVDALAKQAVGAGAKVMQPVMDQMWGDRMGKLVDPYGHQWSIATHIEDVSHAEVIARFEAFMKKAS
jgi:PhnB protein